jgi:hypothetical protein
LQTRTIIAFASWACSLLAGCGPEPLFPADWEQKFTEVRNCRRSGDHDLNFVRIYADAAALQPYQGRAMPFPTGAVVLKAEFAKSDCTEAVGFTAMKREAGSDWHWQKLTPARAVTDDGKLVRCQGCHAACGVPPDGHDGTCAAP